MAGGLGGPLSHSRGSVDGPRLVVSILLALILLEAFMFQVLRRMDRNQWGQGLAEYALILGLIAVVSIVALIFMGTTISTMLSKISGTL